jgi:hypothetical protein
MSRKLDLDEAPAEADDRPMRATLSRMWRFVARLVDDGLPMSPDDRAARDWDATSGEEQSRRRRLRLRLHMLEKRGKGGYR